MTANHTAGPWQIKRSSQGYPYAITAPNGKRGPGGIVDVTRWAAISLPSSKEAEANARLMAASPDLAGTLLELLEYFEDRQDISNETDDDGSPLPNREMQIASEIKDVLTKAGVTV